MSVPKNIGIIIGSVRAVRIGPKVATLIKSLLEESTLSQTANLTLVDLKDFNLPIMDESVIPAMVPAHAQFQHQHSIDWSAEISKYDGYIMVSPEYNFGIPGGLKNAIDYLYHAWVGKPVLIVTYGIAGGSKASDALKTTLGGMHLDVCETRPQLEFPGKGPKIPITPTGQSAMVGDLHEEAKAAWKSGKDKEVLIMGLGELVKKFEAKENIA